MRNKGKKGCTDEQGTKGSGVELIQTGPNKSLQRPGHANDGFLEYKSPSA